METHEVMELIVRGLWTMSILLLPTAVTTAFLILVAVKAHEVVTIIANVAVKIHQIFTIITYGNVRQHFD